MTQKELFIKALRARGSVLIATRTKYEVYSRPDYPGTYYFLGSGGSLRAGPNKTGSLAVSSKFRDTLKKEALSQIAAEKAVASMRKVTTP